jgi:hypothetical protein
MRRRPDVLAIFCTSSLIDKAVQREYVGIMVNESRWKSIEGSFGISELVPILTILVGRSRD